MPDPNLSSVCSIGCAGWSIRGDQSHLFPTEGAHLVRYAGRLGAVEINSSFYRPHRRATYERWSASVPERFRFAVKAPKEISHERRFVDCVVPLEIFLDEVSGLGDRLGPILLQLPPSMEYCRVISEKFLSMLRARYEGPVVLEPRHATWFDDVPERQLASFRITRAAADPAIVPAASEPGGWPGLSYFRLHGSPKIYESAYGAERLDALASRLHDCGLRGQAWCIFDNTKYGAAVVDAFALAERDLPPARVDPEARRAANS